MKNKAYLFSLIVIILIIASYGFKHYAEKVKDKHCFTTQISSLFFDFNTFELKVNSTLALKDFKVVNKNSGKTIFENGKSRKGIKNEYGYCIFDLFWKEKKVFEIGHFKTNNWHTNNYELNITIENNKLKPSLEIIGIDSNRTNLYIKRLP